MRNQVDNTLKHAAASIVTAMILCLIMLAGSAQLAHAQDTAISEENFPDDNFREYIASYYDSNKDGILSQAEADKVTDIEDLYENYEFASLAGIENFKNLETIYLVNSGIRYLDVSQNTSLISMNINDNRLVSLDVSNNKALKNLYCEFNDLVYLTLPEGAALERLECGGNELESLVVSGCSELKGLACGANDLTALDLSANPKLEYLECVGTDMKSLDLSHNPALKSLICNGNSFTTLDLSKNLDLLYVYQHGYENYGSKEGAEWIEYGCMYGSDSYYMTIPPKTKILTGGIYSGKDGSNIETSKGNFKVLSTSSKTLAYYRAPNKKSVTVPNTFKVNGKTFKVTKIMNVAFRGDKIRTVTLGKNIKAIDKDAFNGSPAKKIILKTKLLKKAKVKGCLTSSKVKTIQVKVSTKKAENKKYVKKYKKYFTKKNAGKKVTVR
ncbi:MAG: hypothetical protein IJJ06_12150 [Mogibacterium sp.]|nr:hypothetical protein [Mogibacterium sp.]MBR0342948.1 hypothetical protein [Oscillospiraceae bacterium]